MCGKWGENKFVFLSVCVSCASLISAFPLSLFPPQTGFNYCPCSDLKPLWPMRTAPSPALIAAHTSLPLQTSPLLYSPLLLSFLVVPFCVFLFFFPILFFLFSFFCLSFRLSLPSSCSSSPTTSKLSSIYKPPQVVSVLIPYFQPCVNVKPRHSGCCVRHQGGKSYFKWT